MDLLEASKVRINLVCDFPLEDRNKLLKIALGVLQQSPDQDYHGLVKKYLNNKNKSIEEMYEILSILIAIVRLFLKTPDKLFVSNLLEIGFTREFIDTLPLIENRKEVTNNLYNTTFNNFSDIKWRIDISLSNSSLVGKNLPTVIIIITLKNKKSYTIDVDAKTFHKLRFNIALILKELSTLRKYLNK